MSDDLEDYSAQNPARLTPKKGVGAGGNGWTQDEDGRWMPTVERTAKILQAFERGGCHVALMSDIVFSHILDEIGVENLVKGIKEAMGANRQVVVKMGGVEGDEEVQEFPDHNTRLKAIGIALEQLTSEKRMTALHLHKHRHEGAGAGGETGGSDIDRIKSSPAAKRAVLRQLGVPGDMLDRVLEATERAGGEVVDVPAGKGKGGKP